jgi:hypothetical protein
VIDTWRPCDNDLYSDLQIRETLVCSSDGEGKESPCHAWPPESAKKICASILCANTCDKLVTAPSFVKSVAMTTSKQMAHHSSDSHSMKGKAYQTERSPKHSLLQLLAHPVLWFPLYSDRLPLLWPVSHEMNASQMSDGPFALKWSLRQI